MNTPVNPLPRWRGFNLLEKFSQRGGIKPFREEDFALLAEWGFDWARLPMTYMAWTCEDDLYALKEDQLLEIDQAVAFGQQYGIHVCLSFHRAPGFSVNGERQEPFSLWRDQAALDCCTFHWQHFAQRYAGIPSEQLSFNLWNEPEEPTRAKMTRDDHARVVRHVVAAIRAIDPARPIVADGVHWGTKPLPELADLPIYQSCRGYHPVEVTHYQASWNDPGVYPLPCWPLRHENISPELKKYYKKNDSINLAPHGSDRATLEQFYQPWVDLLAKGVGVHCGEMGCYSKTPHAVVLAWMEDVLSVLAERNIGFGLWNFRGTFGPLDSQRDDVHYEDFRGHQLDRQMLELLLRY